MNKAGFSLVEVMVSGALLGVVVLMLALQQIQQARSSASSGADAQGRQSLQEIASAIASSAGMFPPLISGSNPVLYVGCFQKDRSPRERVSGGSDLTGYYAIFPASTVSKHMQLNAANGGTVYCRDGMGGFEVHVYYEPGATAGSIDTSQLTVAVIPLRESATSISSHVKAFEMRFALDRI